MSLPLDNPIGLAEAGDVGIVERDFAVVIVTVAYRITAKGAFAIAACGFYKISLAFFKPHITVPYLRIKVGPAPEDMWYH